MKAFFKEKFEYTHHSNQQLINVLLKNPETYKDRIKFLASHTLNAHHIWNHRIYKVQPALSVGQLLEIKDLQIINDENHIYSIELLHQKSLDAEIEYTNSLGHDYKNSISDIFFHIINHSTYHRGQLISLLKSSGVEPIITDYIFYKR